MIKEDSEWLWKVIPSATQTIQSEVHEWKISNKVYHRDDGPAYVDYKIQKWYFLGKLHRRDGPAIITDSRREWRIHGKLHREYDEPAIVYCNGDMEWWVNGKNHRKEGNPSVISKSVKMWRVDGKLHRLDGPAIERTSGYTEYWVDGKPTQLTIWNHDLQNYLQNI